MSDAIISFIFIFFTFSLLFFYEFFEFVPKFLSYNPFHYIQDDKDILKLAENLLEFSKNSIEDLKAYSIVEKQTLKEVNGVGYILSHNKTKARVVVILNDDTNKVFNIG